jgi:hypothetical protein
MGYIDQVTISLILIGNKNRVDNFGCLPLIAFGEFLNNTRRNGSDEKVVGNSIICAHNNLN